MLGLVSVGERALVKHPPSQRHPNPPEGGQAQGDFLAAGVDTDGRGASVMVGRFGKTYS